MAERNTTGSCHRESRRILSLRALRRSLQNLRNFVLKTREKKPPLLKLKGQSSLKTFGVHDRLPKFPEILLVHSYGTLGGTLYVSIHRIRALKRTGL